MTTRILTPRKLPPLILQLPKTASFPRTSKVVPPVSGSLAAGMPAIAPYDPPVQASAPPPPVLINDGVGDNYESAFRQILCTDIPNGNIPAQRAPASVYETHKRWQAIDVYVATNFAGASAVVWLTVVVYAITRGVRTVVATGRLRGSGVASPTGFFRVASARVQADKFEVCIQKAGNGAAATQIAQVAIVASNDANNSEDEATDGVMSTSTALAIGAGGIQGVGTTEGLVPITPVSISAVNTSGVIRYVQLAVSAVGATMAAWMIAAGGTLQFADPKFLRRYRTFGTLVIRESSTPVVYTATADVPKEFWIR